MIGINGKQVYLHICTSRIYMVDKFLPASDCYLATISFTGISEITSEMCSRRSALLQACLHHCLKRQTATKERQLGLHVRSPPVDYSGSLCRAPSISPLTLQIISTEPVMLSSTLRASPQSGQSGMAVRQAQLRLPLCWCPTQRSHKPMWVLASA